MKKYFKNVFAIALISTAAGRTAEDRSKVINIIKLIKQNGIAKIVNTLIDRWFTAEFINLHPDIIQNRIQQIIATDPEIILNVFPPSTIVTDLPSLSNRSC